MLFTYSADKDEYQGCELTLARALEPEYMYTIAVGLNQLDQIILNNLSRLLAQENFHRSSLIGLESLAKMALHIQIVAVKSYATQILLISHGKIIQDHYCISPSSDVSLRFTNTTPLGGVTQVLGGLARTSDIALRRMLVICWSALSESRVRE